MRRAASLFLGALFAAGASSPGSTATPGPTPAGSPPPAAIVATASSARVTTPTSGAGPSPAPAGSTPAQAATPPAASLGSDWAQVPLTSGFVNASINDAVSLSDGRFLAVGRRKTGVESYVAVAWSSADGITWTAQDLPGGTAATAVATDGGVIVVVGTLDFAPHESVAVTWQSTDGAMTWRRTVLTKRVESLISGIGALVHGPAGWLALGSAYVGERSTCGGCGDGVTPAARLTAAVGGAMPTADSATAALQPGQRAWLSSDGVSWRESKGPPTESFVTGLVAAGPGYVVMTWEDGAWTSPDGVAWTRAASPRTSRPIERLVAGPDSILAAGQADAWSSPNGQTWRHVADWEDFRLSDPLPYASVDWMTLAWTSLGFTAANLTPENGPGMYQTVEFVVSVDGHEWNPVGSWTSREGWQAVVSRIVGGGDRLVAVGTQGGWLEEPDRALVLVSPAGLVPSTLPAARGSIVDLGTLGGRATATDINGAGQVVGYSASVDGTHGFLWEAGRMTELTTPSGGSVIPKAINDLGQVVGVAAAANGESHAFLWDGGRMTDLGALGAPGSRATDINNLGVVVGVRDSAPGQRTCGFVWEAGKVTDLCLTDALAVNDAGTAVGQGFPIGDGPPPAWVVFGNLDWGGYTLPALAGGPSSPYDINAGGSDEDGWLIVGTSLAANGRTHAVRWLGSDLGMDNLHDNVIEDLGTLGGPDVEASAYGLNENGEIVGESGVGGRSEASRAVLWAGGAIRDLGTLGGDSSVAKAINNDGVVAGSAQDASGAWHAVLWVIERPSAAVPPAIPTPQPTPTPAGSPTPTPAPVATPTPAPGPVNPVVGRMAVVAADTRLVVRTRPGTGTNSKVLAWYLYPQQRAEILEGPVRASGSPWYRVRVSGDEGWVAGRSRTGERWLAAVTPDRAIAAGARHTCVATGAGGARCWGANWFGQLGDGTSTSSDTPVDVSGLASGVAAIATGGYHTCALTSTGGVRCWGTNGFGQLGDGTTTNRSTPVDVVGLTAGVVAIAAGRQHTCALTSGGGVTCWGRNDRGQLGDGTTASRGAPVDVRGLTSGVSAIAAREDETCAVTVGGGVKCWGFNDYGQLGDGTTASRHTAVDVVGLSSGVTAISVGGWHACALMSTGGARCWGYNRDGQLGDGTQTASRTPVAVLGLTSAVGAITAGAGYTCSLTGAGGLECWGNNDLGQLGDGTRTRRPAPVGVVRLDSGVAAVAAGGNHTCALTVAGEVRCWGHNGDGQLGDGTRTRRPSPVDVDFTLRQTIRLRPSTPAGTIARGTLVTFTASVHQLGPSGARATVRFVVKHRTTGAWILVEQRDVRTDATGLATLRLTLSTAGSWVVRAQALDNERSAASRWSANLVYTVP